MKLKEEETNRSFKQLQWRYSFPTIYVLLIIFGYIAGHDCFRVLFNVSTFEIVLTFGENRQNGFGSYEYSSW